MKENGPRRRRCRSLDRRAVRRHLLRPPSPPRRRLRLRRSIRRRTPFPRRRHPPLQRRAVQSPELDGGGRAGSPSLGPDGPPPPLLVVASSSSSSNPAAALRRQNHLRGQVERNLHPRIDLNSASPVKYEFVVIIVADAPDDRVPQQPHLLLRAQPSLDRTVQQFPYVDRPMLLLTLLPLLLPPAAAVVPPPIVVDSLLCRYP